jgi:hypothetical protein
LRVSVPLSDQKPTRQPQSRRCHLPNNQIVKDHHRLRSHLAPRDEPFRQMPAEQEARTTFPHGMPLFDRSLPTATTTKSESRSCFAPSRQLLTLESDQSGQFRGKRLNIELGSQVVNSGQIYSSCVRKNLPKPSFYFASFTTYFLNPSSEVNYIGLEPNRARGPLKNR